MAKISNLASFNSLVLCIKLLVCGQWLGSFLIKSMATNHARETSYVLLSSPINRVEFRAEREEKKISEKDPFIRKKEVKPKQQKKNTPYIKPSCIFNLLPLQKKKKTKIPLSIPFIFFSHKPVTKGPHTNSTTVFPFQCSFSFSFKQFFHASYQQPPQAPSHLDQHHQQHYSHHASLPSQVNIVFSSFSAYQQPASLTPPSTSTKTTTPRLKLY